MARSADLTWFLAVDREDSRSGSCVLTLSGRLGQAAAPQLGEAVGRAIESGNRLIVLDLSGVDYVNSAGLAEIGRAADLLHRHGGSLTLAGVRGPVELALQLAGPIPHTTVRPA